jgi:hypothetical protein
MNSGAQMAQGENLLFLHCDSRFADVLLIQKAIDHMLQARTFSGTYKIAGHYSLKFMRESLGYSLLYYYFETKTQTNYPETINGDQGFYISKSFFNEIGGFDEKLDYLEDTRLAKQIAVKGRWLFLPGLIYTSARRFESEGFLKRQLLNTLLRVFNELDIPDYFANVKAAYQIQSNTHAIVLSPFFMAAHKALLSRGCRQAVIFWFKIGRYFSNNLWQFALFFDCLRNRKTGELSGNCEKKCLNAYDKYCKKIALSNIVIVLNSIILGLNYYIIYLAILIGNKIKTKIK